MKEFTKSHYETLMCIFCQIGRMLIYIFLIFFSAVRPATAEVSACQALFSKQPQIRQVLAESIERFGANSNDANLNAFLDRAERKSVLGELDVLWLARLTLNSRNRSKAHEIESRNFADRWIKEKSSSYKLQKFIDENVVRHGYTDTLRRVGLLRNSSDVERFRIFLDQFQISHLITQILIAGVSAHFLGPAVLPYNLAEARVPWLRSVSLSEQEVKALIDKGVNDGFSENSIDNIRSILKQRANIEATQDWIRSVVRLTFYVTIFYFIYQNKDLFKMAIQSLISPLTQIQIDRAKDELGISRRVEIQLNSWEVAYRQVFGETPSESQKAAKAFEFSKILSGPSSR